MVWHKNQNVQSGNSNSCVKRRKSVFHKISCVLAFVVWFLGCEGLVISGRAMTTRYTEQETDLRNEEGKTRSKH